MTEFPTPEQIHRAGYLEGWAAATFAVAALFRDRSAAYYGRGSEALVAAIENGEHEAYDEDTQ